MLTRVLQDDQPAKDGVEDPPGPRLATLCLLVVLTRYLYQQTAGAFLFATTRCGWDGWAEDGCIVVSDVDPIRRCDISWAPPHPSTGGTRQTRKDIFEEYMVKKHTQKEQMTMGEFGQFQLFGLSSATDATPLESTVTQTIYRLPRRQPLQVLHSEH